MPSFGQRSLGRLETVVPELAVVCHEVIRTLDFTVLCGRRGKDEQNEAFVGASLESNAIRQGKHKLEPTYPRGES